MIRSKLFHPGLAAFAVLAGAAFGFTGCSDSGTPEGGAGTGGSGGTMTTAGTGGTAGSPVTGGAGVGGATTGGAGAGGSAAGIGGGTGGAGTGGTGGTMAGASAGGGAGTGGSAGDGMGGAGAAGAPMGGMVGAGTSGAGMSGSAGSGTSGSAGSAGGGAEDLDMQAEDFECIADWMQVRGFRITNKLGHLTEAIAVAENDEGGVFPVGTILQHLPTEAMVKRRAGFSAETKDWEFFILSLSQAGETTIVQRGTTDVQAQGMDPCASCHSDVPDQFDFVCNTWGDQGGANCGFNFMQSFLDQQLATDTRCP
jgi:hypothetical protein